MPVFGGGLGAHGKRPLVALSSYGHTAVAIEPYGPRAEVFTLGETVFAETRERHLGEAVGGA